MEDRPISRKAAALAAAALALIAVAGFPFLDRMPGSPPLGPKEWARTWEYASGAYRLRSGKTWHRTVPGKDHWLFYHEELENDFPLAESRAFARNLKLLEAFYEAHGSRFLFFIVPDKHRIYPEFLPATARRDFPACEQDLSPLLGAMRDEGVAFLDLYAFLERAKRAHPADWFLYAPGGTHWTPYGTGLVLGEVFRRLGRAWKDSPPTGFGWSDHDELLGMLDLGPQTRFRRQVPLAEPGAPLRSRPETLPGHREWLLVGDSFLRMTSCAFLLRRHPLEFASIGQELMRAQDFRYVYGLSPGPGDLDRETYDRVVYGFVEYALAAYYERFRDLTRFGMFPEIFARARRVYSLHGAPTACRDLRITAGDGLRFAITGGHPAFAFPEFRAGWSSDYNQWVRLEVESDGSMETGIRFRTPAGEDSAFFRPGSGIATGYLLLPRGSTDLEILPAKGSARVGAAWTLRGLDIAL